MVKIELNLTRRHLYTVIAIVAAFALIIPTAGWAADKFKDVPDTNVFHDDIAWLADAGVTRGCNPPANDEFCPGDNVRRETMAAFMHRLAVNQVVDAGTVQGYTASELMTGTQGPAGPEGPEGPPGPTDLGYATMAVVTSDVYGPGVVLEKQITLPWAGFAVVSGQVSFDSTASNAYDTVACGISEGTDPAFAYEGTWRYPTLDYLSNPYPTCDTQTVLVLDDGTHNVRLTVQGTESTTFVDSGNLVITVSRFMPVPSGSGSFSRQETRSDHSLTD